MSPPSASSESIRRYWEQRFLGAQYVSDHTLPVGSPEFFAHIRPWMNPYKFPWIMQRIQDEAALLAGKRLLEIGCGLGFDSLEFIRRGVRVTATDLTETAVRLAKQHFCVAGVAAEAVQVEDVLDLSFADEAFDAVWANGVVHATGDPQRALREIHRVLKHGGRAIISHFYRKPSWMYWLHRVAREPIEHPDRDPPVNEFMTDCAIEALFADFEIHATSREHHRALPISRRGLKATLYSTLFRPAYNCLPEPLALALAYKLSVTAIKR